MDTKALAGFKILDEDKGEVVAAFAAFNKIDADGDVTLPGAFDDGVSVPISAYGHSSWRDAAPVGVATIMQTAKEARAVGRFFLDTDAGRDTFRAVKQLAERGLGEWSYGYEPVEYSFGEFEGQQVRFLAKQKVFEVSPVLQGVGVGTRTLSAKAADGVAAELRRIRARQFGRDDALREWLHAVRRKAGHR